MQIDPVYPETREFMKNWLTQWCETHPATTVVRFTSMFYNFVWIWGSSERNRQLFSDWASYDFTVSPKMLDEFSEKYGYKLTSEDFINKGKLHATHLTCPKSKLDYMSFVNDFVVDFGKELIDIVHSYGKKAYVFYDDSWVGVEPWSPRFKDFGFDGLIKCVFNGFETRLCAGVDAVETHEIRLHPYLFPVGLGGAPTFAPGGNPTLEAQGYWKNVRRALLRNKIDRIGLGGYLSLTLPFPDFNDYIEKISDEFRLIKEFHTEGKPYIMKPKIAVLTFWGKLRSWTCSGHYHEHPEVDLINVIESLSGLPFDVDFISFDDVKNNGTDGLNKYDVIINAGFAKSSWSGYEQWGDERVISLLTEWAYNGGVFIGINEPSAYEGADTYFRMAHVLGIDADLGERICHGKYTFEIQGCPCCQMQLTADDFKKKPELYLTDADTKVILADGDTPCLTIHDFGKGKGIYMSSYTNSDKAARALMSIILNSTGEGTDQLYMTDNIYCECAYYPSVNKLVVINNSDTEQTTTVKTDMGDKTVTLDAFDTKIIEL